MTIEGKEMGTTNEETATTKKSKKGFIGWILGIFTAIGGFFAYLFVSKRRIGSNLSNIGKGFDNTREQLDSTQRAIQGATTDTAELGKSINDCEQRVNECEDILKRVREQGQKSTK